MYRYVFFLLFLGLAESTGQESHYDYFEVGSLRGEMNQAQQDWKTTYPDLETHLGTAPKDQVLQEIHAASAAAAKFTELELQYYEARAKVVTYQIATFQQGSGESSVDLAKEMIAAMKGMLQDLAADRQSIQTRLDQLNKPGVKLTSDQVLVREQLEKELKEVTSSYFTLEEQIRKLENEPRPTSRNVIDARNALVKTLQQVLGDTQRQAASAKQEKVLFNSYYGYLNAAVEKRPDEAAPHTTAVEPTPKPVKPAINRGFGGSWVVPEKSARPINGCVLKSADMTLVSRGPERPMSGEVLLTYVPSPQERCTFSGFPIWLKLTNGKSIDSVTSTLHFRGVSDPKRDLVKYEVRGTATIRLINDYQLTLSLTLDDSKSNQEIPKLKEQRFERIPDDAQTSSGKGPKPAEPNKR